MEEKSGKSTKIWAILAILAGLFLCFVLGTLFGGGIGYIMATRTRFAPGPMERPLPQREQVPSLPGRPELPERWQDMLPMRGALVTEVVEDSPAEKAELRAGDRIVAVDDETLMGEKDGYSLADLIARYEVGDRVRLTVVRGSREQAVFVKLGRHPDRGGETPWLGIYYQDLGQLEMPRD